jgi:hypothetical protein
MRYEKIVGWVLLAIGTGFYLFFAIPEFTGIIGAG